MQDFLEKDISLYKTEKSLTPILSEQYSILLNQISKNLSFTSSYEMNDSNNQEGSNHCKILITYINDIILPEIYAYFHDQRINNKHRQKLYELTIKIWEFSCSFKDKIKAEDTNSDILADYQAEKGKGPQIAHTILSLIKLSNIEKHNYLHSLEIFIDNYLNPNTYEDLLINQKDNIVSHIKVMTKSRLACYQHINITKIISHSELFNKDLLNLKTQHPLIEHLLDECDLEILLINQNAVQHKDSTRKHLIESVSRKNIKLTFILVLIMALISDASILFSILMLSFFISYAINYLVNAELALKIFNNPILLKISDTILNNYRLSLVIVFICSIFLKLNFYIIFFIFMSIILSFYEYYTNRLYPFAQKIKPEKLSHLENNSTINQYKKENKKQDLNSSSKNYNEFESFNIYHDAKHLRLLLSDPSLDILTELSDTINELYEHLDYLKEGDSYYLATYVKELIIDIMTNSVSRLDNVAKEFVRNGTVKDNAKKLFISQHDKQINQLFIHHIEELKDLNQSILEKHMSGFSQTGTEVERQFRDTVMELKILLKWHIAQHNDTTKNRVILNKLQNSTFKDMTDVFYKSTTTESQRVQLQEQANDLLKHFQSQSSINHLMNTDIESNLMRKLEHTIPNKSNLEDIKDQVSTQEYIDFNAQYIKQLKKHW